MINLEKLNTQEKKILFEKLLNEFTERKISATIEQDNYLSDENNPFYENDIARLFIFKQPRDCFLGEKIENDFSLDDLKKDLNALNASIEAANLLELYNKYINGEIYQVLIFEKKKISIDKETFENQIVVDSCGGFYSIEDAKSWILGCYGDININES